MAQYEDAVREPPSGDEAAGRGGRAVTADEFTARGTARLPSHGGHDDVAVLLRRRPGPLDLAFPAESSQLAPVREALRAWLDHCRVPPRTRQNVLVAAGEACANAIEHGHRHARGATVRLHADASADGVRLVVADSGSWRTPQPQARPHRGRGMALMRALMQQVTVTPGPSGTSVEMRTRITR
ncbi:ATP-binding protein [Streptomyces sp. NPDC046831]|uniref:ATP-binding protein n=1 Tax=Streptomyces sp. NPDC046831 TaxID=3154805 RepID=UPI0033E6C93B